MSCCDCCAVRAEPCAAYHKGVEGYFTCPGPECSASGVAWGTGPYTADSCVCKAARHAGAIGPNGGTFRVSMAPGQSTYGGSTEHGTTTQPYGRYDISIKITKA
uniref:LCCL domain-containing protein n=1 Tax=Neobodo designis TaxID=312471 RepID=A0A6U4QLW3_NEODS|mmetsp:Transcript_19956/g.61959  ORF Transcript_19956/g.61959 Transcript_19956/m.61959 type:complete len:104 (+) Transcript_19956:100-411(+)|eukprot:CAMPEP_0174827764 /NCGR_PEP_ID=MMETSP1114-20130205/919_1 /TAXON_ID=312471 /ORGANISM="Neobodo designis, Strain CCAP 1951/1" /LENGTH=103 /DNA_ID=CAMNT_0016061441 /DNA_START=98 /DNA_END=409 /DNA_ORIENTATION=-